MGLTSVRKLEEFGGLPAPKDFFFYGQLGYKKFIKFTSYINLLHETGFHITIIWRVWNYTYIFERLLYRNQLSKNGAGELKITVSLGH